MPRGTLTVLLVNAKGLNGTDSIMKMDPYVILSCHSRKMKSNVAFLGGRNPEWNQTFVFHIPDGVEDLNLKIMDKDILSADDFVGQAQIPLEGAFLRGKISPTSYRVVLANNAYRGEIKVGLSFEPHGYNYTNY